MYVELTTTDVVLQTARSEMNNVGRKNGLVGISECKLKWKLSTSCEQLHAAQFSLLEVGVGRRHPENRGTPIG